MSKGRKQGKEHFTVERVRNNVPWGNMRYRRDLEEAASDGQTNLHRITVKTTPTVATKRSISKWIPITNDYTYSVSHPDSEKDLTLIRRFGSLIS